jgi:outer membrane lipoprotein-sorting protein
LRFRNARGILRKKVKNNIIRITLAVLLAVSSFTVSALAADSCQPVFDALTKLITTSSHSYTTSTAVNGGKQRTGETIMTQGKKYIRANGKWIDSRVTTTEVLEQDRENEKNSKATCQLVRNEAVNGEASAVYFLHRELEGFKEDSQIWISKSSGMPLREEQDVDMGGEVGKMHNSARFEYGNVQPPM